MSRVPLVLVLLGVSLLIAGSTCSRPRDLGLLLYHLTRPPPPPPVPYWSPVRGCPPDIYWFNRLECYNNGRYLDSPNNRNRQNKNNHLKREREQSRRLQANKELAKFNSNWYRPGITGNNAIKL